MIDIKFIRENPDKVQKGAGDKGIKIDINQILDSDKTYRKLSESVQKLREERNKAAEKKDIEKGKEIKEKLDKQEQELRLAKEKLDDLLLKIPNPPLKDVPIGDESKNKIIKKVGNPKKFDFAPRDHVEIGENLDLIDVKRAAKVSGTRFGYLKNEAVLLELALIQFVLEKLTKEGFIPVVPPALIKKEITEKLGYWHGMKNGITSNEEYYWVQDPKENQEMYLIGTAEHSVVPMHKDEVFMGKDLPRRYIAFSPAFRREAGSYGKDTKGIFRVHQFDKLEMVSFVKPEDDEKERKRLLSLAEDLVSELGFSYQLVKLASQDMSFPAAETIDIETWIPSQKRYRETHSISTTTDFQARRLNIKYQDGAEKKYVHILNGTAFAIGRTIIAILENYQKKDGIVDVPKVLQKYIGKTSIKPKK
ncbi:MAG: serine--tRNA ligase [Candidatus Levybacteria bacterium RIFCSPLOWO2_02_FULL_37_10]|nr:MAG: serine--tRNA ligase [Candidatus Levybacteria bacterium RIFCSPHIGHO2_01_FULL_37_33]OGH29026.1 MAG: serine--tRNA ligase [Candidatus Levybacteria bacterium RIFCSPHIGHO2_12_FULL_37_12]OGH33075.1 MAG: serine--tRNA ligase [Candidatus Levybacteria bacterium RIFCSPLOWO2_01_FULL_36_54]OGH45783.1 MAG: serine--tRNA ligase [Candidatus Levybacteria bacterium RIFCSPLOWO2_02_FULL_37_10]